MYKSNSLQDRCLILQVVLGAIATASASSLMMRPETQTYWPLIACVLLIFQVCIQMVLPLVLLEAIWDESTDWSEALLVILINGAAAASVFGVSFMLFDGNMKVAFMGAYSCICAFMLWLLSYKLQQNCIVHNAIRMKDGSVRVYLVHIRVLLHCIHDWYDVPYDVRCAASDLIYLERQGVKFSPQSAEDLKDIREKLVIIYKHPSSIYEFSGCDAFKACCSDLNAALGKAFADIDIELSKVCTRELETYSESYGRELSNALGLM